MRFFWPVGMMVVTLLILLQTISPITATDPAIYDGMEKPPTTAEPVTSIEDDDDEWNDNDDDDWADLDEDNWDDFEENQSLKPQPSTSSSRAEPEIENERPIIGILVHKYVSHSVHHGRWECADNEGKNKSYVPASIVKFIEAGGARTVPIKAHGTKKYLRRMFRSVNGIYYPGADTGLHHSEYGRAGKYLYNLAIKANNAGTYFPLWGECLGLQFLLMTAGGSRSAQKTSCQSLNQSYAINFTDEAHQSRLYGQMPVSIITAMEKKPLCAHNHAYCVKVENFKKFKFLKNQQFRILSTNYEETTNTTFVSSAEAVNYPFYALGFHPETNMYVWGSHYNINHSAAAIEMAQYFIRFFVNEARKNNHHFKTEWEEWSNLMVNFRLACDGAIYFIPRHKNQTNTEPVTTTTTSNTTTT